MSGFDEATKSAWLLRVLGIVLPGAGPAAAVSRPDRVASALKGWDTVRAGAVAQLKEVGKEIADARHPESAAALIELGAVTRQLTAKPDTLQQVAELERYLREDDVVADVCDFAHNIRGPLLRCLAQIKAALDVHADAGGRQP